MGSSTSPSVLVVAISLALLLQLLLVAATASSSNSRLEFVLGRVAALSPPGSLSRAQVEQQAQEILELEKALRRNPDDDLRFLQAMVRQYWPGVVQKNLVELFAELLLKVADEEEGSSFHHHHHLGFNLSAAPTRFECEVYPPSPQVPTLVSKLRPGDIKVVGALGDSLTAAFGAKAATIFTLFNDYRGVSYANGGDNKAHTLITLGSILEQYNPDIKGLSTGKGGINSAGANLNLAVTGARNQDLAGQVTNLISRMKADKEINFEKDWKMVSILIGNNNLCDFCDDAEYNGPETYAKLIEESIDTLAAHVPRLLINLIPPIDVTLLHEVSSGFCSLLHVFECSCSVKDEPTRKAVSEAQTAYYAQSKRIAALSKYKRDDFAVVVQPFLSETDIPRKPNGKPDTSYLAPDCFHFSAKAHQAAGLALWNNVFEKDKQTIWLPGEPIKCPEEGATIPV